MALAQPANIKYAFVKSRPFLADGDLANTPNTLPMPEEDKRFTKGDTIFVNSHWWKYIEKINPPKSYKWLRIPSLMWINNTDWEIDTPYSTAKAEPVICGENFVSYDDESPTHVHLTAFREDEDTSKLDPEKDNWFHRPDMFFKANMIREDGRIFNVGKALDVYIPRIAHKHLWLPKSDLILFPPGDFVLFGCNVSAGDGTPLLTYPDGIRTFHNPEMFSLPGSQGVVPPPGWR